MGIGIPFPNRMVASIFPCNRLKYGYIRCIITAYMSKLDVDISGLAHKHIYNYTYMWKYVCKSIWMCLKIGRPKKMLVFSLSSLLPNKNLCFIVPIPQVFQVSKPYALMKHAASKKPRSTGLRDGGLCRVLNPSHFGLKPKRHFKPT